MDEQQRESVKIFDQEVDAGNKPKEDLDTMPEQAPVEIVPQVVGANVISLAAAQKARRGE